MNPFITRIRDVFTPDDTPDQTAVIDLHKRLQVGDDNFMQDWLDTWAGVCNHVSSKTMEEVIGQGAPPTIAVHLAAEAAPPMAGLMLFCMGMAFAERDAADLATAVTDDALAQFLAD